MSPKRKRRKSPGDPHPAPKFRVIGPLSNSPEFQKALSCRTGAEMVRAPEKRCAVWSKARDW
ncbi:MAG: M13-type metalloendopeptidase [Thermoanaerobaculia bacterium]